LLSKQKQRTGGKLLGRYDFAQPFRSRRKGDSPALQDP